MKKIYVLWSIAIATLCANVFFACKSDDTLEDFYRRHGLTMDLVKTPDFVVYSDGNVLSSTLTTKAETRGEGGLKIYDIWNLPQGYTMPEEVSGSAIASYVESHKNEGTTTCDLTDFFIQQVYAYDYGWNTVDYKWLCPKDEMNNLSINGVVLNGSNSANNFPGFLCLNMNLTNIKYTCSVWGNNAEVSNAYKFYTIDGNIYLCLEFISTFGNYAGDGVYKDWIFKITPAASNNGGDDNGGDDNGGDNNGGDNNGGDNGGTDVDVNGNYFKVQDWENTATEHMPAAYAPYAASAPSKTDRGENVSQAEYDYVMAYLAAHPDEGGTECDLTTYFIQNVGGSFFEYLCSEFPTLTDHNGASHNVVGSQQMDFVGFSKHRNDYNAVGGPRALCLNIPIEDPTYHDSWGDTENTKHDAYRFYEIEFNGEKNLYLCYDYQTKKNSGEYLPGDKVFNDWVIKIIPADGKKPEIKELPKTHDEVEINLSVNDEKENGDYIATKLSIHIRALTDVEVFIPVARDYYCDVDDMAIVYSHKLDPNYQYSNPGENAAGNVYTYTYTVAGDYVVEGVTYTANEAINVIVTYEENGIRVKTQGMTQAALDYLQYTYNDGITFEVWNYFNSVITNEALETIPVTRADLKPMFDQSTVTFTASDHPEQYINAFAMLYEYKKLDLHVYMKENKPYLLDVTTNAEGRVVSETPTDNLLSTQYWVANEDGSFKEFVGARNEWDCTVSPSDEWTKVKINNGKSPANYNEIYTK